jgi:hypothetical protein
VRSRPVRWIQANAALIAGASVVVGVLVLAVLIFFVLPPLIVSSTDVPNDGQRLKLQNDVRTTGVQLLAGAILAAGAFFTARTIRVNREGQITERFTRAIDQLGSQQLDVRLGGIYALERIARDSRRDHGPIMEVLATYVREHARWDPAEDGNGLAGQDPDEHPGRELKLPLWSGPTPAADVQAVLTVLGRRKTSHELDPLEIDLSNVDLRGAEFRGQFQHVIFADAHLEGAGFYAVDLRHAVRAFSACRYPTTPTTRQTKRRNARLVRPGGRFVSRPEIPTSGGAVRAQEGLDGSYSQGSVCLGVGAESLREQGVVELLPHRRRVAVPAERRKGDDKGRSAFTGRRR